MALTHQAMIGFADRSERGVPVYPEDGVRIFGFSPGTIDTDMQVKIRASGMNMVSQIPRANAFGYYCYLIGGSLLYVAFFLHVGPDAGWFAYVPLSGPEYSPGKRVDIWAQMITFTEFSALLEAVTLISFAPRVE